MLAGVVALAILIQLRCATLTVTAGTAQPLAFAGATVASAAPGAPSKTTLLNSGTDLTCLQVPQLERAWLYTPMRVAIVF